MGLFTKNYMKYFPDGFTLKTRLSSKVSDYHLFNNDQSTQWFIIGKIVNGELVTEGTEGGYTWGSMIFFNQFNEELKKVYALKQYCDTIGVQLAGMDLTAGWLATRDDLISGWSVEDNTENRQIYDDIFLRNGYSANPDASLVDKVRGFWQWLFNDLDASYDSAIERDDLMNPTIPAKMYEPTLVNTVKGDNDVISSAVMNTSQDYGGVTAQHEIDLSHLDTSIQELNQSLFGSNVGFNWSYIADIMESSNGHLWIYKLSRTDLLDCSLYLVVPTEIPLSSREDPYSAHYEQVFDQGGIYKDSGVDHPHGRPNATATYDWYWIDSTDPTQQSRARGFYSKASVNLYICVGYVDHTVVGVDNSSLTNTDALRLLSGIDFTDPTTYEELFEQGILTWTTIVKDNLWGFEEGGASDSTVLNGIRDPLNSDGSFASAVGASIIGGAIAAIASQFGVDENGNFISINPSINNKDDALDYLDDLSKNTGFFTGQPDEYLPSLPWGSNELFTIWNISWSDLADLGHYLWTHNWDLSHMFMSSSPSDAIISLSAFPVEFVDLPKMNFHMAGQTFQKQIEVIGNAVGTFDCGKITITEFYKSFLDYNPYTKVTAYLPFIGFVDLNVDDLIGATSIQLKYRIEFLTGNCLATITVERPNFKVCFYQYSGNCAIQIPLTGSRQSNALLGLVAGAGGVAGAIASGNPMFAVGGAQALEGIAKKEPTRSGSMQGNVGLLGNMQPYVIIERKVPNNSEAYSSLVGRPSNDYKALRECSGFVQFSDFKLNNLKCNDSQKSMIETLLRNGIFID